ncbi:MAG TPA: hypothetical protein VMU28_13290 [Terriglobales bacterium]|nr:hypothetical protein [Terriglobales bacterium]
MRKYSLVLLTVALLTLFTVSVAAQSSSDNGSAQGSSAQSNSSAPSQSGSSSDTNAQASASSGQQSLDGCVVKENTDYFIQPVSGERRHLTGSQDLSSSVGKHVRVQGTDQTSTASNAGTSSNSTSGSASNEAQNNAAGSIAGNSGSSNASGASGSAGAPDFLVTKVETVSESCPADIQNKIDQSKSK